MIKNARDKYPTFSLSKFYNFLERFLHQKQLEKLSELYTFPSGKRHFLTHYYSDKGLDGTVVHRSIL